jgi:membrane protein DedA with SNARE-associated domain
MEDLLARLGSLEHWQIALLASYFLLQGLVLAVFPEEVIITTLGLLWGQGKIGFFEALIAVWIGLLPANSATVFIGSRFGPRVLAMRPFCWMFKKKAVEDSLVKVRKYGKWIVFLTRFTPIIRGPIYLAAGLSQMGVRNFFKIDILASSIQIPLLLLLGSAIGKNANSMMEAYQKIGLFMIVIVVAMVGFQFMIQRKKRSVLVEDSLGQVAPLKESETAS